MVNLEKLEKLVQEALAKETPESMLEWLENERLKDLANQQNISFNGNLVEDKSESISCNYLEDRKYTSKTSDNIMPNESNYFYAA